MADFNVKISKVEAMLNKNLPEEVIADILSRLPAKSLLRFKSVCKSWYALTIDPSFVKMHLSRSLASNAYLSLILSDCSLYSVDLDSSEPQELVKLDHRPKFLNDVTEIMGSCNGLLCIYNSEDIFLWNPSTRRHLKLPINPTSNLARFVLYGFGYDPITEDYKVVRVVDFDEEVEVKVYSLSTNSWRRIADMPFRINHCDSDHQIFGVLVNSALHWVAQSETVSNFIVSFDLQDEESREVPLPDFVDDKFYMTVRVLGGQLCLVCEFWRDRFDFWVMKDYGVRDSWVKQFSIKQQLLENCGFIRPICYSKNGEVILEMNDDVLIGYDTRRRRCRDLISVQDYIQTEIYIESLIPLNMKDGTEEAETEEEEEEEEEEEDEEEEEAEEAEEEKEEEAEVVAQNQPTQLTLLDYHKLNEGVEDLIICDGSYVPDLVIGSSQESELQGMLQGVRQAKQYG